MLLSVVHLKVEINQGPDCIFVFADLMQIKHLDYFK